MSHDAFFRAQYQREFEPEGGSVYSERCVGDQHYVCVVNPDQQNPERVRGFPVEIDVEKEENDAGDNIFDDDDRDSGYVPTSKVRSGIRSGTSAKEAQGCS